MKLPSIAEIRKAIVAAVGLAGMAVTAGFLHGRLLIDVESGIAILTALLNYQIPNKPAKPALGDPVFAPDPAPAVVQPPQPAAQV